MPLSEFPVRAQIGVSDIQRAVAFYEGKLGLPALRSGPSAAIEDGGRIYGSGGVPALVVYQTAASVSDATSATWFVDDIDQIVHELIDRGVELVRMTGSITMTKASQVVQAGAASRGSRTRTATRSPLSPIPEHEQVPAPRLLGLAEPDEPSLREGAGLVQKRFLLAARDRQRVSHVTIRWSTRSVRTRATSAHRLIPS